MLVDTHCHLDASEFDGDREAVIARARAAGVTRQILPGTHADEWALLRDACLLDPGLYAAYGMHPTFLEHHDDAHLGLLDEWVRRERPVAIGECGLDYYVEGLDLEAQQRWFDGHLELARATGLPLIVHARRAVDAVIQSIRRVGKVHGVVHSFAGSEEQARQLHQLGFLIGIGGPVTYERAKRMHRVVAAVPLEQLLLETDAPDQPDSGHRGQRNEPARLTRVCDVVAGLRGMSPGDLAEATTRNACRLFGLPQ